MGGTRLQPPCPSPRISANPLRSHAPRKNYVPLQPALRVLLGASKVGLLAFRVCSPVAAYSICYGRSASDSNGPDCLGGSRKDGRAGFQSGRHSTQHGASSLGVRSLSAPAAACYQGEATEAYRYAARPQNKAQSTSGLAFRPGYSTSCFSPCCKLSVRRRRYRRTRCGGESSHLPAAHCRKCVPTQVVVSQQGVLASLQPSPH